MIGYRVATQAATGAYLYSEAGRLPVVPFIARFFRNEILNPQAHTGASAGRVQSSPDGPSEPTDHISVGQSTSNVHSPGAASGDGFGCASGDHVSAGAASGDGFGCASGDSFSEVLGFLSGDGHSSGDRW